MHLYEHRISTRNAQQMTMTGPSQTLILSDGEILLGIWQDLYFCEYDGLRNRTFL